MPEEEKEILTVDEAAAYLKLSKRSIFLLVKNKEIPHRKIFNRCRFVREDLRKWVAGED